MTQVDDINRLNAGLYMDYAGSTPVISSEWKHVMAVTLPSYTVAQEFNLTRRNHSCRADTTTSSMQTSRNSNEIAKHE